MRFLLSILLLLLLTVSFSVLPAVDGSSSVSVSVSVSAAEPQTAASHSLSDHADSNSGYEVDDATDGSKPSRTVRQSAAAVAKAPTDPMKDFLSWAVKFGKKYTTQAKVLRQKFKVWKANKAEIETKNRAANGDVLYQLDQDADLSEKEFIQFRTGALPDENKLNGQQEGEAEVNTAGALDWITIPDGVQPSLNWGADRSKSTGVRDQASCGSCTIFSITNHLETRNAIKNGVLVELSEQNLLDCSFVKSRDTGFAFTMNGCKGNNIGNVLRWMAATNFSPSTRSGWFDYKAYVRETCKDQPSKVAVQQANYIWPLLQESVNQVFQELKNGPLVIQVNGVAALRGYWKGILGSQNACLNGKEQDAGSHAMTLVGYGFDKEANKHFWIVRNSWSSGWGEKGFVRIERGIDWCGLESSGFSFATMKEATFDKPQK